MKLVNLGSTSLRLGLVVGVLGYLRVELGLNYGTPGWTRDH
jgi:hypothetical protein